MTLDYTTCICRFDGMVCIVDVTCPIHRAFNFAQDDVAFLRWHANYAREQSGPQIAESFDFDGIADRIEALLQPETP